MIEKLINDALLKEQEARKGRKRSGKWSPKASYKQKHLTNYNKCGIIHLIGGALWERLLNVELVVRNLAVGIKNNNIVQSLVFGNIQENLKEYIMQKNVFIANGQNPFQNFMKEKKQKHIRDIGQLVKNVKYNKLNYMQKKIKIK